MGAIFGFMVGLLGVLFVACVVLLACVMAVHIVDDLFFRDRIKQKVRKWFDKKWGDKDD